MRHCFGLLFFSVALVCRTLLCREDFSTCQKSLRVLQGLKTPNTEITKTLRVLCSTSSGDVVAPRRFSTITPGQGWLKLPIFDCRLPIPDAPWKELPRDFFNRQSAISSETLLFGCGSKPRCDLRGPAGAG